MAVESPGFANQSSTYGAEQTRRAVFSWLSRTGANTPGIVSGGLLSSSDCQLSAPVSGMSVNVSTGEVLIGGSEGANQGAYYGRATSTTNLVVAASNASNPRVDMVCATISDSAYTEPTGGSGNQFAFQVLTGTATSGATLSNLTGAPSLPLSSLLLGYILVPANSTNVTNGNISNVATRAQFGLTVPLSSLPDPTTGKVIGSASSAAAAVFPPGYEIGYDQVTSNVTVSSSTEASGTTVVSCAAHTFDGSPVVAEFFAYSANANGGTLTVSLFESSTQIGRIASTAGSASVNGVLVGRLRFTPSAASHTYTVTAICSNPNGSILAGAGGTGTGVPIFVRFTKV